MCIVIIGGNERMKCQYQNICKNYKCKAKVFIDMPGDLKSRIGSPDLVILFTSTVSHKMVTCAVSEAARLNTKIIRSHSSSSAALTEILKKHISEEKCS